GEVTHQARVPAIAGPVDPKRSFIPKSQKNEFGKRVSFRIHLRAEGMPELCEASFNILRCSIVERGTVLLLVPHHARAKLFCCTLAVVRKSFAINPAPGR